MQVQRAGRQGAVCGDRWGLAEAAVVCRQLGCGHARVAPTYAVWAGDTELLLLQGVRCEGTEASLWGCALGPWGPVRGCACECYGAVQCSGEARPAPTRPATPRNRTQPLPSPSHPHCEDPVRAAASPPKAGEARARSTREEHSPVARPGQPFLGLACSPVVATHPSAVKSPGFPLRRARRCSPGPLSRGASPCPGARPAVTPLPRAQGTGHAARPSPPRWSPVGGRPLAAQAACSTGGRPATACGRGCAPAQRGAQVRRAGLCTSCRWGCGHGQAESRRQPLCGDP